MSIGRSFLVGIAVLWASLGAANAQCALSLNNVTVCNNSVAVLGLGMQLTIASVPSNSLITDFQWTSSTGFSSNQQFPVVSNPQAGTYTLTVQVPGCGSVSETINLSTTNNNCPNAAFASSPAVLCSGNSMSFINQSTPGGLSYTWFFGDGTTSNANSPSHVYTAPQGTGITGYTVTLVAINAAGVMDVQQSTIQVQQIPPEPEITSNQLQPYNGQEYLVACTDNSSELIFIQGLANNPGAWAQNFTLDWGDGTPLVNPASFASTQNHAYAQGLYTLTVNMLGPNGCSILNTYPVFVGNIPAVNLGSPGNTTQCSPYTFNFPIDSVSNNEIGTTYTVTFSDGGAPQIFNHPPPAFVSHTFTQSSCGETSLNNLPDAFWVQITAQNPCDIAVSTIEPIRISTAPNAQFTALPDPVCINSTVTVNSTADPGTNVNAAGCNTNHGMVWSISPATGWTLSSGTLGSVNAQPNNYTAWTNGSTQLQLSFNIDTIYTITQRIRNSCGEDVFTENVCVVPPLTANFTLSGAPCAPSVLSTDNLTTPINTCVPPVYVWSINAPSNASTPPFVPPFIANSFEPEWLLTQDGTYTVNLSATNACGTSTATNNFTIVAPPVVNLSAPPLGCLPAPYTFDPSVTYDDGGGTITLQQWQIDGGPWQTITPAEPVDFPPQVFNVGIHTIKVSITNECGSDTSQVSFTVSSPPNISIIDSTVCQGQAEPVNNGINPATGLPTLSYVWSGSSAVVFSDNGIANPLITVSSPNNQTATLTVTDGGGCVSSETFNLIVNPLPVLTATSNEKCIGSPAVPLSVSSNISGTLFSWSPSTGLDTTSDSIVHANPPSTTTYTITGTDSATGCSSVTTVTLTVNPLPVVNVVDTTICAQPISIDLTQATPDDGIWTDPTPATGSLTLLNDVYSYTPPITPGNDTLIYTYTDINNGCVNSDTMRVQILPVDSSEAGPDFNVCNNAPIVNLTTGTPTGGIWSGSGVVLNGNTFQLNPASLAPGAYWLFYTINANTNCEYTDSLLATVFPVPAVNTLTDDTCSGISITLTPGVSGGTAPLTYAWSPNTGLQGLSTLPSATFLHTQLWPNDTVYNYTLTVSDANNCVASNTVSLTVHPLPVVSIDLIDSLCTQPIDTQLTVDVNANGGLGSWIGNNISPSGLFTPPATSGSQWVYYTHTDVYGCFNQDSTLIDLIVPVVPDAGLPLSFCLNDSALIPTPASNPGGIWSGPGVDAGIFDPLVAGVGTHTLTYTINQGTTCETSDTVVYMVLPIPSVNAGADISICSGLTAVLTATASGGSGSLNYLWSPTNGIQTGQGTSSIQVDTSVSATASQTFQITVSDTNNCTVSDIVILMIDTLPVVSAGVPDTLCDQPISYSLAGLPVAGFGETGIWSIGLTNLSGNNFIPNDTGQVALTYTFTDTNGCIDSADVELTIVAPQFPDAGVDFGICNNAATVQLQPVTLPGGTWSGSGINIAGVFDPSSVAPGTYTLVYTINDGTTCETTDELDVTVFEVPIVGTLTASVCSFDSVTLAPLVSVGTTPYSYLWSPATGIIGPVNQSSAVVSLFQPPPSNAQYIYSFTVTDSNNCIASNAVNLTVSSLPVVNVGPDLSTCFSPGVPFQILNSITPPGGTWINFPGNVGTLNGLDFQTGGIGLDSLSYSFTDNNGCSNADTLVIDVVSPISVEVGPPMALCETDAVFDLPMPLPLNPPANYTTTWIGNGVELINGVYRFNPALAAAGVNTLNYSFQEVGNTCAAGDELQIYVGTVPQLILPDVSICTGLDTTITVTMLPGTGTAPYNYLWDPNSALSQSSESSAVYSAINDSTLAQNDTLTITVTDSAGCVATASMVVTINPLPVVYAGIDSALCNQPIMYPLGGSANVPGNGVWSGSPNIVVNTFLPNGEDTVTLTYTFTDDNGCVNSDQVSLTVNPPIFPNAGPDEDFCLEDAAFTLLPITQPGGIWSGPGVSLVAGNYEFDPSDAGVGTHSIVYTIFDGTTCETYDTLVYKVFPMPSVDAGNNQQMCSGDTISISGIVSLGTLPYQYAWAPITGILSGSATATASIRLFNTTADDITQSYTLTLTDSAGCIASDTTIITIHPLPDVNAGLDDTLCNQPIAHTLLGYSPPAGPGENGIWSGSPNLSGDEFTPNGLGTATLTYTFTDNNGCINSDQVSLTLVEPEIPDAGPDMEFCSYDADQSLPATTIPGGIWSGTGVVQTTTGYDFSPTLAGVGTFILVYTVFDGTTCETTDTIQVIVHPPPNVDAGNDISLCISDACINLSGFSPSNSGQLPATAYFYGDGTITASGQFCPALNLPGDYTIGFHYTEPTTGCFNTDQLIISNHPLPVAEFVVDDVFCTNTDEIIQNLSQNDTIYGGVPAYSWNVINVNGDTVLNSSQESFTLALPDTGNYTVHLQVETAFGCVAAAAESIYLIETPYPAFTLSGDTACAPVQIAINNTSEGYDVVYNWLVANGQDTVYYSSDSAALPINFPSPILGDTTFVVTLTLGNECGAAVLERPFVGRPTPVARPGVLADTACSPFIPVFQNLSYGTPTSYFWDFGNGNTSTEFEPEGQVFMAIDNDTTQYTILLEAINECGVDSTRFPITVLPNTVTAFFNTDPPFGCAELAVDFTNVSSGADQFFWDFGDGTPVVTTYNTSHVFETGGVYTVSMIATDGCSYDTAYATVNVLPKPDVSFMPVQNAICQGSVAEFVNTSQGAVAYLWNFGDNEQIAAFEPPHVYVEPGVYPVRLIGYSPVYGCPDTAFQNITVQSIPDLSVAPNPAMGCMPLPVQFENNSINATSYEWNLGNGATTTSAFPSVVYLQPGDYEVNLIAHNYNFANNLDCPIDTQLTITVFETPVSSFSLDVATSCGDTARVGVNNASQGADSYLWKWADNESFLFEPSIFLSDTGLIPIDLVCSNVFGCSDTTTELYDLIGQPDTRLRIRPPVGCEPLEVEFNSLTEYGDFWQWDFGDGSNVQSGRNPIHTYENAGVYSVNLSVSNEGACFADTLLEFAVEVKRRAVAGIELEPEEITLGEPVLNLINTSTFASEYWLDIGDGTIYEGFINQHVYNNLSENDESVQLMFVANNANNCPDTLYKSIGVIPSSGIFISNSFSPNGDGINEEWGPIIAGKVNYYELLVFNRWGEQIFQSKDRDIKWDGWYLNQPVQIDVYVYRLVVSFDKEDKRYERIGRVSVVR